MSVCVITGVGPGNGLSLSRKFAGEGYRVAMLARSEEPLRELADEIDGGRPYPVDVGDRERVHEVFESIRKDLGPVSVLIHNAGSGVFGSFLDAAPDDFERAWRTNAYGLLLCGQEAVRDMTATGGGSLIVVGATAALRGGAGFASFASAKAAQRSLAQSMARSLGPQGIHVAYVSDGLKLAQLSREPPSTRHNLPQFGCPGSPMGPLG